LLCVGCHIYVHLPGGTKFSSLFLNLFKMKENNNNEKDQHQTSSGNQVNNPAQENRTTTERATQPVTIETNRQSSTDNQMNEGVNQNNHAQKDSENK
jgi:hypothetical protein